MKFHDFIEAENFFRRKEKPSKVKKDFTLKDFIKFQKELEEFEKWKKEQDDKKKPKDDKKKDGFMTVPQITMLLVASFPITAPLYVYWIKGILVGLK